MPVPELDISDTLASIEDINRQVDYFLVEMGIFKPSKKGPTLSPVRKASSSDENSPISLEALLAYQKNQKRGIQAFTPPATPLKNTQTPNLSHTPRRFVASKSVPTTPNKKVVGLFHSPIKSSDSEGSPALPGKSAKKTGLFYDSRGSIISKSTQVSQCYALIGPDGPRPVSR